MAPQALLRRNLDRIVSAGPLPLVELFVASNIAFLALDVSIAHAVNAFRHPAEWIPPVFSLIAPALLVLAMLLEGLQPSPAETVLRRRLGRFVGLVVGSVSVLVGVGGLLYHLQSQFFEFQTLKNLVYTAPFAAPLAYAGLGLLLILNRMVDARSLEWGRWVILFALGGFAGNFVLSLADHAQNGFYDPFEWLAVGSSAFAVGALVAVLLIPNNRPLLFFCGAWMVLQVVVGGLGAVLHVVGDLHEPAGTLWEKFLYGAPVFAPLLFADLAVLAGIGLWSLSRLTDQEPGLALVAH